MCDVFYHVLQKKESLFEYNTTIHNGVVMCNDIISDINLNSYMSKTICTETMLKLFNTLALEYCVNYFLTIDDLYNGANCKFISSGCWHMICWNIKFDLGFGQEVKVKMGSPFCKYFWKLTICTIVQTIVNLRLSVVEIWFCEIWNFDFRFGQEVKVKLGHFCINIIWQLTICTMVQTFWIYLLWLFRYDFFYISHFDFRFGQEVEVKLGHLFVNIFWQLTICTIVQKLWIYHQKKVESYIFPKPVEQNCNFLTVSCNHWF